MLNYTLRRTLQALPLLILISVISFAIINMAPGDVTSMFINPESDPADIEALRQHFGLDKPLFVRYFIWFGKVLSGDLGTSMWVGRSVMEMIIEKLPNTLMLAGLSMLISFAVAIPIGIISATKRYSIFDYAATTFAFIGLSLPSFWFGLMLILFFSLQLGWLPSGGMRANFDQFDVVDRLRHLILPAIVLATGSMASKARYMRSSMLEVIRQDYIRTARAKGLSDRVVIYKHALKNALLPVITLFGLILPGLVSGAVITETIFSWPGMGRMAVEAIWTRDYPVIMGVNMMGALMVILGSLVADLGYALADPRIKYN